ncbi:hypothetical protein ANN_20715 [Periplaneta americana]|uniref:Reverse transcriptase domain-containing protein n=1 Tax=Periplaneta americana TaxID=6978 RepID=A0ABQ8SDC5_PERAM|nr:hypothetical protein ANN_20715 [Periplaneta americana]
MSTRNSMLRKRNEQAVTQPKDVIQQAVVLRMSSPTCKATQISLRDQLRKALENSKTVRVERQSTPRKNEEWNMHTQNKYWVVSKLVIFCILLTVASAQFDVPEADTSEEPWTGRWMPHPPYSEPETNIIDVLHDREHGVKMGVKTTECDDAKTNLTMDWDYSPSNYTCYNYNSKIVPDWRIKPILECENIPRYYTVLNYNHQQELDINISQQRRKLLKDIPPEPRRLAVASFRLNTEHDILGKHLNRLGILPSASCILCHQQEEMDRQHLAKCPALKSSTEVDRYWEARARIGTHRPLWPRYGEYKFVPRQRWVHSLEHGAVVMLYHPCANQLEVNRLRHLVIRCLRRHIITPHALLDEERTNGILQGDLLSPILFNVLTHDVMKEMEGVSTYIYANDMAIAATDLDNIQSALDTLSKWAERNDIKINEEKTELVVFRKGGRLNEEENVKCNGKQLKRKSDFKYLGITIQTTGKSFRLHIRSRVMAATRAMNEIRNITQLSISTAMDLFRIKILPILTYGLESVGEYLTYKQMEELERVKARGPKVRNNAPSERHLQDLHEKKTSIPEEFYAMCAMQDRTWTEANHEMRHVTTRLATYGFHHKVCGNKTYHEPNDKCVCVLCSELCDRYHIIKCMKRQKSIAAYSKDKYHQSEEAADNRENPSDLDAVAELIRWHQAVIHPLALVTWGCRLTMSTVQPGIVQNFIKQHALQGPEKISKDGQYDLGLKVAAQILTDTDDSILCPRH